MQMSRRYFLEDQTLSVLDNQSRKLTAHSRKAIYWLFYREMKDGITIKHARNGEVRVESYRVDGFCQDTGCVYSFHGCF